MEIQEGNKLIAEFMNEEYRNGTVIRYSNTAQCRINPNGEVGHPIKYNTSWDWLMPVVEKIGDTRVKSKASYNPDLMFKIEIVNGYTHISGTGHHIFCNSCIEGGMLNATFKAVIKFIEWYNKEV